MRVVIVGGGVIGVTSAWYLAREGHEVTVLDRQPGPALETSFANAGEVSPGYSSPWAGPGMPLKAIKWLLMKHGPLAIRPRLDPAMWSWILKMLSNCTSLFKEGALVSTVVMTDLMFVSQNIANRTGHPVEILTAAALIYFVIAFPITRAVTRLETRTLKRLAM